MRLKKYIILLIVLPLIFHIAMYFFSIPYAKPFIEEQLKASLGTQVSIQDARIYLLTRSIHISQPKIEIEVNNKKETLFKAKKIKLRFKLLPLLQKKFIFSNAAVYSPVFHIERNAQGEYNYDEYIKRITRSFTPSALLTNLFKPDSAYAETLSDTNSNSTDTATTDNYTFYVNKLYIKNGTIHFKDFYTTPTNNLTLFNIKLATTQRYNDKTNDIIAIKFKLFASSNPTNNNTHNIRIAGEIDPSQAHESPYFTLNTTISQFNTMKIWPYITQYVPFTIDRGSININSQVKCTDGVFTDSKQTITIEQLNILSWDTDFSEDKTMGFSNKLIMDFVEKNKDSLSFDFYITGNIKEIHITPGELVIRAFTETLLSNAVKKLIE
ncbi:MAG: DUF748 domain-containing protein [Candidatus Ancaeobacter aquaticus]|nr:DUF748 domain-containing protein [Candidatus Ancaeobacter aquaticus]